MNSATSLFLGFVTFLLFGAVSPVRFTNNTALKLAEVGIVLAAIGISTMFISSGVKWSRIGQILMTTSIIALLCAIVYQIKIG